MNGSIIRLWITYNIIEKTEDAFDSLDIFLVDPKGRK